MAGSGPAPPVVATAAAAGSPDLEPRGRPMEVAPLAGPPSDRSASAPAQPPRSDSQKRVASQVLTSEFAKAPRTAAAPSESAAPAASSSSSSNPAPTAPTPTTARVGLTTALGALGMQTVKTGAAFEAEEDSPQTATVSEAPAVKPKSSLLAWIIARDKQPELVLYVDEKKVEVTLTGSSVLFEAAFGSSFPAYDRRSMQLPEPTPNPVQNLLSPMYETFCKTGKLQVFAISQQPLDTQTAGAIAALLEQQEGLRVSIIILGLSSESS